MADALVQALNRTGFQPVFLPSTGLTPPDLYNFTRRAGKPRLVRREPFPPHLPSAATTPVPPRTPPHPTRPFHLPPPRRETPAGAAGPVRPLSAWRRNTAGTPQHPARHQPPAHLRQRPVRLHRIPHPVPGLPWHYRRTPHRL